MLPDRRGADFDEFVRARTTALLRMAYLLTGDRHAAEDLLQDVLSATYVRWPHIRGAPEAYVRQGLINRATRRWSLRGRRREQPLSPTEFLLAEPDHAEGFVAREALLAALRALPKRQRAAVVLRYLEDLPITEVARLLGCSEGAVKSHTSRGLERLRDVLPSPAASARPTVSEGDRR